jgi:hypothetical protein
LYTGKNRNNPAKEAGKCKRRTARQRERTRMNTHMRISVYMHSSVLSLVVTNPPSLPVPTKQNHRSSHCRIVGPVAHGVCVSKAQISRDFNHRCCNRLGSEESTDMISRWSETAMRALAGVTKNKKRKKKKKEQRTRKTRQTNGLQKNVHHGPKPNIATDFRKQKTEHSDGFWEPPPPRQHISDPSRVLQRTSQTKPPRGEPDMRGQGETR